MPIDEEDDNEEDEIEEKTVANNIYDRPIGKYLMDEFIRKETKVEIHILIKTNRLWITLNDVTIKPVYCEDFDYIALDEKGKVVLNFKFADVDLIIQNQDYIRITVD